MIPVLIVLVAVVGAVAMTAIAKGITDPKILAAAAMGPALVGILIAVILAIILTLIAIIGVIRFARTGKMGEAFNFG